MSFEKVVCSEIFGVTVQPTDCRMPVGYSAAGTHTKIINPMNGTLMWDRAMYVLHDVAIAGGATGGSFTVTIQTDAVDGYTGLPIATAAGLGPSTPATVVMDNLHQSAASPIATHIFIDQTAAGTLTFTCDVIAKQYRGTLGTASCKTSERIIQGTMIRGASATGTFCTGGHGFVSDETVALGTSSSTIGLHRMRLWDNALYWVVAGESASGTHDVDIIAVVGGITTSIASTGTGGALDTAGEKLALTNAFYGQSPNPTAIIWTEVTTGGVSDARVVAMAKTGRGSMIKR